MSGKYPPVPLREIKHCKDFLWTTAKTQVSMFYSRHPEYDMNFADYVLSALGHGNTCDNIPFRDARNLRVEVINSLSRQLAYYMKYPQRFGNHPSNAIAPQLMYLAHRLMRVRSGHGLSPLSLRPMSKVQFGVFVKRLIDDGRLWNYAEWFVKVLERRIKSGHADL